MAGPSHGREIGLPQWRARRGGLSRATTGFVAIDQEDKVLCLRKALCGLHQACLVWNSKLDATLTTLGFHHSDSDMPSRSVDQAPISCLLGCTLTTLLSLHRHHRDQPVQGRDGGVVPDERPWVALLLPLIEV